MSGVAVQAEARHAQWIVSLLPRERAATDRAIGKERAAVREEKRMPHFMQQRPSFRRDGPHLIDAIRLAWHRRIRLAARNVVHKPQPKRHLRVSSAHVRMPRAACRPSVHNRESRLIAEIVSAVCHARRAHTGRRGLRRADGEGGGIRIRTRALDSERPIDSVESGLPVGPRDGHAITVRVAARRRKIGVVTISGLNEPLRGLDGYRCGSPGIHNRN